MFLGSIPDQVAYFLARAIKNISFAQAVVPCSGNFVIEQILRSKGNDFPIHGYDVNVYSCAIGCYLSNKPFHLEVIRDDFSFLQPFHDGLDKAAKVAFLSELAQYAKLKHAHDKRSYTRIIDQAGKTIDAFKQKISKVKETLPNYTFHPEDMNNCFGSLDSESLVIFDPPFWSRGYEKMFSFINEVIRWDAPPYEDISEKNRFDIIRRFTDTGCKLFIIVDGFRDELIEMGLSPVYIYERSLTHGFVVYSNTCHDKCVSRWQFHEDLANYQLLDDNYDITPKDRIGIIQVSSLIGNHYRNMWTKKANMSTGGFCFLVTINDMVTGLLQVDSGFFRISQPSILLFADPAVPSTRYKRLSKLILMVLLTKEFKKIVDDLFVFDHETVNTRVVTNNQVSMKYRGLFELNTKKKANGKENYEYILTYGAKLGQFKLKNVIREWLQKYEQPAKRNRAA